MDKKRLLCTVNKTKIMKYFFPILLCLVILSKPSYADNTTITIDNKTRAEAQELFDKVLGTEGQKLIEETMRNITSEMNIYTPEVAPGQKRDARDYDITIFISSTIPMPTLWNYIESADKYNIKMVLRGTVGKDPAKIAPTLDYISTLACKVSKAQLKPTSQCAEIDVSINPQLFKEYSVERVPTTLIKYNGNEYIHTGAASIDYLIEKIK